MNIPNAEYLFRQMGYAPVRSTQADVLRTAGLVAAGVVLGAAIVALTTPKSGPELRSAISDGAGQLKSKASSTALSLKGRINGKAEALKEAANGIRETAEEELRNV